VSHDPKPRWLAELEGRIERGEVPTSESEPVDTTSRPCPPPERDSSVTAFATELLERLESQHVTVDVQAIARRILTNHRRNPYASPDGALVAAVRRAWQENTDQRPAAYRTAQGREEAKARAWLAILQAVAAGAKPAAVAQAMKSGFERPPVRLIALLLDMQNSWIVANSSE
jgi:hypothetical protein